MNFLNTNFKKDEKINEKEHNIQKEHKINKKEETMIEIYMLVIGYIIIFCFGIFFHNSFYNIIPPEIFKISIISTIVLPFVLYSYYIIYTIYEIRENISYEKLLEEASHELEQDYKISSMITVILFGIGVVYGNIQLQTKKKDLLKKVAPYLICSLLFGTIFPTIISHIVFDQTNLNRMIIGSDLSFITVSISFGLIITALLIPLLTLY